MTKERLEEIKDSINFQSVLAEKNGLNATIELINEEKELFNYVVELENMREEIRKYIENVYESDSFTRLPSGKATDVGYCIDALEDIECIINKTNKE